MRILITGINGFIGQHLGDLLLKRGHFVTGIGRSKKCKVANVRIYYKGTVLDKKLVEKAIKDVETVVHLAALTSHEDIVNNRFASLETNFLGTKNILDAFLKSRTSRKLLYSSTGKVYGKVMHLPISENHPISPLNILGKSKLITEKLIDFYNNNQKEFVIFRIFNAYGPRQRENFLIPTILKQLHEGKKEIILGDTDAKRDYVYIDDLVDAFIKTIEQKGPLGVSTYNICTSLGLSASQIVKTISKIKGIDIKVKTNPVLFRVDEMKEEYGSYEKAKKILGWKPKISIKEGLQKLIA
ncbi:MAG: NAD(P)-dependent oxidoreductase [Patescibacteria group bacterium]|nr:NAD(P)-dependent oxidoreductase [Patescibacteria group bacterium]